MVFRQKDMLSFLNRDPPSRMPGHMVWQLRSTSDEILQKFYQLGDLACFDILHIKYKWMVEKIKFKCCLKGLD